MARMRRSLMTKESLAPRSLIQYRYILNKTSAHAALGRQFQRFRNINGLADGRFPKIDGE